MLDALRPVWDHLHVRGYRPILVGGCVRDALLGIQSKDIDIEVYGVASMEALEASIRPLGVVHSVGKSFGVIKLQWRGWECDIALPRTERKIGHGHQGFAVELHQECDFAFAARRRDFTINAIGYDPIDGVWHDPYGGREDLRLGILRYVDRETFGEDPLRVWRLVQFVARFGFRVDPDLFALAHTMVAGSELEYLPKERIFDEVKKLLLKAPRPSYGIALAHRLGIVSGLLPMALDVCFLDGLESISCERDRLVIGCALLGYSGRCAHLDEWSGEHRLIEEVEALCAHSEAMRAPLSDAQLRHLSTRVDLRRWAQMGYMLGLADWRERIEDLGELPPTPLLRGRDLIALGMHPSRTFGPLLERAYQAQLDGAFYSHDEALAWFVTQQ